MIGIWRSSVRGFVNPPIRYEEDKEALWRRLHDGTIDCVVTDHAPHSLESKSVGYPGSPAACLALRHPSSNVDSCNEWKMQG